MAEENNAFGKFGARNAKFDELLKKYQTIEEGDTVKAPVNAAQPVSDFASKTETLPEQVVQVTASQPPEEPKAIFDSQPEIIIKPQIVAESHPETQDFNFDESYANREFVQNSLAETEVIEETEIIPEPETVTEPEEEPDYSYDIDIFSAGGASTVPDIDSFDDSWIDMALDNSFFYKPEPVPEPAPEPVSEPDYATEIASESEYIPEPVEEEYEVDLSDECEEAETVSDQCQSVPVTEYEQECYITDPVQYNPKAFTPQEQNSLAKDAMAGGYIAPSDINDFEFDPESGVSFEVSEVPAQTSLAKTAKQKKKSAREKKESGKNEMSSVTGFSKNYKASEGKGSKKDGFMVRNFIPKNTDTSLEKARKIIMVACVLTFFVAAVYLFSDFVVQPVMTSKRLEKLEQMVGDSNKVADKNELAEEYPGVDFPDGMLEKYAELYAENEDLVGWITIDGIDVSLPVVQGEDNTEYLKRDFDGNYNKYGSVFMNCANDEKNLNYNTALFGHHMLDEKMFGNLNLYKDAEYYKKAPVIEFNTIYGDYKWKIFAVFITNGTADGDDGYIFDYTFTDLSSPEAVEKFLGEVNQRAIYKPEVDISVSDKILTLSTCSYEFDEARLVVMARMVRPGESEEVSGKVITNDNPRYPAAYYEEKGLSNPYESAYKWQPS